MDIDTMGLMVGSLASIAALSYFGRKSHARSETGVSEDRISVYHADHGVRKSLLAKVLSPSTQGYFAQTFPVPEGEPSLWSALYGPRAGDPPIAEDEVVYRPRGDRSYVSRLVDRPMRKSRKLSVIGTANDGRFQIYTAHGGEIADREPSDPHIQSAAELQASRAFWKEHALSSRPIPSDG